jgi:16S rRNA processing protein RimM
MTDPGQTIIPVGYVRRAHGIRGDVVVRGLVEDASDRFVPAASFDTNENPPRVLTIESSDASGADLRIHFEGVNDRNEAESLKGVQLVMDAADRRELAVGEWWPEELVGCAVTDVSGTAIGKVVEVIPAGAQDRLVIVRPDGARAEVPFVDALVPQVDVVALAITVDLPEGLFA